MGYARAGFNVTGVDIRRQPRYPFRFIQADALEYATAHGRRYHAIHASPPCQAHTVAQHQAKKDHSATGWMLPATRVILRGLGLPWVIENVPGAPMARHYRLCGCGLGLWRLRRERWFETSWRVSDLERAPCRHPPHPEGSALSVAGSSGGFGRRGREIGRVAEWRKAMGIDWMTADELAQAVPPAYTQHIGADLMGVVR